MHVRSEGCHQPHTLEPESEWTGPDLVAPGVAAPATVEPRVGVVAGLALAPGCWLSSESIEQRPGSAMDKMKDEGFGSGPRVIGVTRFTIVGISHIIIGS